MVFLKIIMVFCYIISSFLTSLYVSTYLLGKINGLEEMMRTIKGEEAANKIIKIKEGKELFLTFAFPILALALLIQLIINIF